MASSLDTSTALEVCNLKHSDEVSQKMVVRLSWKPARVIMQRMECAVSALAGFVCESDDSAHVSRGRLSKYSHFVLRADAPATATCSVWSKMLRIA